MSCSTIDRGSQADCDDLPTPGTEARLILINWDDVLYIFEGNDTSESGRVWDNTFDNTFGPMVVAGVGLGVITQIVLYPGKQAYEFFGFRNDVKKVEEVERISSNKKRFLHRCGFVIYEVDQLQKVNINHMAKGRFMAIVERKGGDEDSLELLGRDCGLKMQAGRIRDVHQNSGVFIIDLATPGGVEYERKLPQTVGTSYTNGLEIIDDLLESEEIGFITEDGAEVFESEDGLIFIPE